MEKSDLKKFQVSLLKWYEKNARDLPWRRTKDPYKIWVSEIMLQQTQVATVIPYYEKWIKKFPTIRKLAAAPTEDVMAYWAGLGYYRRARMLHQAAKFLTDQLDEKIPAEPKELEKIPGIGKYTAGAITSIAYDVKAPILDGNVIRILSRIFKINADVGETKTIKKLWVLAEDILPNKKLGDFNQALMELGATICLPENPSCLICPVTKYCKARAAGKQTKYPVKLKREKLESLRTAALVTGTKKKVWIEHQPHEGRWGGLWMFPHWPDKKSMLKEIGIAEDSKKLKQLMKVKHGFTKYKIELEVFESSTIKNFSGKNRRLVPISKLNDYAFPSPHKKIVRKIINDVL